LAPRSGGEDVATKAAIVDESLILTAKPTEVLSKSTSNDEGLREETEAAEESVLTDSSKTGQSKSGNNNTQVDTDIVPSLDINESVEGLKKPTSGNQKESIPSNNSESSSNNSKSSMPFDNDIGLINSTDEIEDMNSTPLNSTDEIEDMNSTPLNSTDEIEDMNSTLLNSTDEIEDMNSTLLNSTDEIEDMNSTLLNSTDEIEDMNSTLLNSTDEIEDMNSTLLNSTDDIEDVNDTLLNSADELEELSSTDETEDINSTLLNSTDEIEEGALINPSNQSLIDSIEDGVNDDVSIPDSLDTTDTIDNSTSNLTDVPETPESLDTNPEDEIVEGAFQRQSQHFPQQHKPQRSNQAINNQQSGPRFGNKNFEDPRDVERGPNDRRLDQRRYRPMPPSSDSNPSIIEEETPEAAHTNGSILSDDSSVPPSLNVTSFSVAKDATGVLDAVSVVDDDLISVEENITARLSTLINNSKPANVSSESTLSPLKATPSSTLVASASSQAQVPSLTPSTAAAVPTIEPPIRSEVTGEKLPTKSPSPTDAAAALPTATGLMSVSSPSGAKVTKAHTGIDMNSDNCSAQLENCRRSMHTVRATRSALFAWRSLFVHAVTSLSKQVASSYPQLLPADLSSIEPLSQVIDGLSVPLEIADEIVQLFISDTNESSTDALAPPSLRSFVIMLRQTSNDARMNALSYLESPERAEVVREHSRDALDSFLSFTFLMTAMAFFSRISSLLISCCCCRCFFRSSKSSSGTVSTKPSAVSKFAPPSPPGPPLLHANRGGSGVDGMKQVFLLPPEGMLPAATLEKLKAAGMTGSKPVGTARRDQIANPPPFASPPPPFARPPQHLDFSAEPANVQPPQQQQQQQQQFQQQTAPLTQIATQSVSDVPKPLFVASSVPAALSTPKNVRKLNSSQPVMPLHGEPSSTR
jgi:hypothetical protein